MRNSTERPLDIVVVAGVRFDTREPHAGGLERQTDVLARVLQRRGHRVTVFAGARVGADRNTDPASAESAGYHIEPLIDHPMEFSDAARRDVSMPPDQFMIEHDAYLDLAHRLDDESFDVVHNNSLHYLPVLSDDRRPIVHTLHTPPTPWLESAHRIGRTRRRHYARTTSVSRDNAARWGDLVDQVVHNGVDVDAWPVGDGGGGYAFWSGRLVPEKGAHLAIRAARRAGIRLLLAGPAHDPEYFDQVLAPEFDRDREYVGHCHSTDVARYLGGASVAVVTPMWDEPFGLVVAEALACGTPVAAFDRGAISELIDRNTGVCVKAGDVDALSRAMVAAGDFDRRACRRLAVEQYSADTMAARYETVYRELVAA